MNPLKESLRVNNTNKHTLRYPSLCLTFKSHFLLSITSKKL